MEVASIFLDKILTRVARQQASSLHFQVGSKPVARIDGRLVELEEEEELTPDMVKKIIGSFVSEEDLAILKKNKEVVVAKAFGNNLRFRINIFYQKRLPSISFNYIPLRIRDLQALDLPANFIKNIFLKSGLLIVAGPHDSGKTSTIASLIDHINKNERKYVITLENPIEYIFVNNKSIIEQRQVGRDVNSYIRGLEHALEEDVDLVFVDEIKDDFAKAMPLILELASGNSLVVLEVKAETSAKAIEKILNIEISKGSIEALRYSLADSLVGVIAQKLIPKIGGGMALAKEILIASSPIKSLIREGKLFQIDSIIQTSREEGMISLRKSIDELLAKGEIGQEEINKLNNQD